MKEPDFIHNFSLMSLKNTKIEIFMRHFSLNWNFLLGNIALQCIGLHFQTSTWFSMTSSVKDQNYFPFNNYQRIDKIGWKNSSKYNTVVKTEHKNKYTQYWSKCSVKLVFLTNLLYIKSLNKQHYHWHTQQ